MPPTADGKVASRVGRPVKDEAHVHNITIQTLLEISWEELFYKIMAIKRNWEEKKKANAGCQGNLSFSGKLLKGNF